MEGANRIGLKDVLGSLVEGGITIDGLVVADHLEENLESGNLMAGNLIDGNKSVTSLEIGGLMVKELIIGGLVTTIGRTHVDALTLILILEKEVDHCGAGLDRHGVGVEG